MSDFRPRAHVEREVAIHSVATYAADPTADPSVVALIGRLFDPERQAFVAARQNYLQAAAKAAAASDRAEEVDEAFDAAFRRWARSVVDENGRTLASELASLVGGRVPSEIVQLPYADEVAYTRVLIEQATTRPRLAGDPAALGALQEATLVLEAALHQDAAAARARLEAGVKVEEATAAFDRAYGKLRRSARAVLSESELVRLLPRFTRTSPDAVVAED